MSRKPPGMPGQLWADLWAHQRNAISFVFPYLRNSRTRSTALLRMPTGTGKTGVIAVLTIALPPAGWSLVLTPWSHLCEQMAKDLRERFWRNTIWKPQDQPTIVRLYPSSLDTVLGKRSSQLVVVATFAPLVTIFREERQKYDELAAKFAQIFVDEGHYEPAVEWGQAVKGLHKPTVLLTATPYRNDLKLFHVLKKDVHHFTHQAAEGKGIIRGVELRPLFTPEPSDKNVGPWCDKFMGFWASRERKKIHKDARAIVCCSRMATVERVTRRLRDAGANAIGIHDRFGDRKEDWLVSTTPDPRKVDFDVWVHQNKLTEGLDDERFCILALVNGIRNDRKLVQQIGRVLRRGPKRIGRAVILFSDGINLKQSWENYREFEVQPDLVDPERYNEILSSILSSQPVMEYFDHRFRRRFDNNAKELVSQVKLPASVVVRRVTRRFDMKEFADFNTDALFLDDRIILGPTGEALEGPLESKLWVYAIFGNSPILIEHSQYEIKLGAMAAVKHGDLLFIADTEGSYPVDYLSEHTTKVAADELGRIFGKNTVPKEVTLINAWPSGPSVRRSSIYADDLTNTPAQLTDAIFVCAGVRATVLPDRKGQLSYRQYVGFHRGRIAEQLGSIKRSTFELRGFVEWTERIAHLIQDTDNKPPEFFLRYLAPIGTPDVVDPKYLVLNLFDGDVELQDEAGKTIDLIEPVMGLQNHTQNTDGSQQSEFAVRYKRDSTDSIEEVRGIANFDPTSGRFQIRGEMLNASITVMRYGAEEAEGLGNYLNKHDQEFTVVLDTSDIYYNAQSFYRIDYEFAESRIADLLTPFASLGSSGSEKGKPKKKDVAWSGDTVFGIITRKTARALLPTNFENVDLLICDDLGKEVADFVCADFQGHRIAFIHAKHSDKRVVSASALHEVVSQAMKNLGVLAKGGKPPTNLARWNRESFWGDTKIPRWQIGGRRLPSGEDLWTKIRNEILDRPDRTVEVWIVVGQTLRKDEFLLALSNPERRDAVTGQVVYLISGLNAECIRLGVKLRIFCH